MRLTGLLSSAKLNEGLTARIFLRHAAAHVFFDCHFKMRSHLFVELLIERSSTEE
jgi:hypothetical protein